MSAWLLFVASAAFGQFPDALDHLRGADVKPQVGLLLDRSCSMGWGRTWTNCYWYARAFQRGDPRLNKKDQMKAALIGCQDPKDGILDTWADRINFSVYEFGRGASLRVPFGSPLGRLESGVRAIPSTGSTHMTRGIRDHARYFRDFLNSRNSLSCRPNFLVMLSDGNPNGGSSMFDFECKYPIESLFVGWWNPWEGSRYIERHEDVLCNVPGDQNIRTYTIGFGRPGDFSPWILQGIAAAGDGAYFPASNAAELSAAFEGIIGSIVKRSALFFAPIEIQTGSLFSDNFAFATSFKPESAGPWRGNIKKHCIAPPRRADGSYDPSVDTCLFVSPDGLNLQTNPLVMDLWTGSRTLNSDEGGAGEVMFSTMRTVSGGRPSGPFYRHRNILTWRPGRTGYVPVNPANLGSDYTWVNGCDRHRLLNLLNGYTYDANCATGNPVATNPWILGDSVHSPPVLLKYGPCENSSGNAVVGRCFLVAGMNDGMLHIFDAANGRETSALIPGELWTPNSVARSNLRDLIAQPSPQFTHRFFVDGGARLFHADDDLDTYIDRNEKAYFVFGLGRGGRAYYSIPVNRLINGVLTTANNPVYPLTRHPGNALGELGDTWAQPWLGRTKWNGVTRDVAVIPSGHIPELDVVSGPVPSGSSGGNIDTNDVRSAACEGPGGLADFNGYAPTWCEDAWFDSCRGTVANPCYDGTGVPLDVAQVVRFDDGTYNAAALRIFFSSFDLAPGDRLRIEDSQGNVVGSYTRNQLAGQWSPWVYDTRMTLRLITDGIDSNNKGYRVKWVEWARGALKPRATPTPFRLGVDHRPNVFAIDLDAFNGASALPFTQEPTDDAVVVRFTNDCAGFDVAKCIDATKAPELAHMICPVSGEVSVWSTGEHVKSLYWGDECGQIWKAWTDDAGVTWNARRLVNLNGGSMRVNKDHRKLFRKLDLVLSTCPGAVAVAVHFGTGNVQRPAATDELADRSITNGRDIVGVVWDHPGLPVNATEAQLLDVTNGYGRPGVQILAGGHHGWYINLPDDERMLRDPFVFEGVYFAKTYRPVTGASECKGGSGVDQIYALNSCNGDAAHDQNQDGVYAVAERKAWSGSTEGGAGMFFFAPKDGSVVVSHMDLSTQQPASLNQSRRIRPGLYFWREF